jgi:hypothetical protein
VKEKSSLDINVHACATFIFILFKKRPSFLTYKTKLVIASILSGVTYINPPVIPFYRFPHYLNSQLIYHYLARNLLIETSRRRGCYIYPH